MIVATTAAVAGRRIVATVGLVFGTAVRTRGIAGNIAAGMAALGQVNGDPLAEYTATLSEARDTALARMEERAVALGANAVVAVRFAHATVEHDMGEIVAYGTAVVVEPEHERVDGLPTETRTFAADHAQGACDMVAMQQQETARTDAAQRTRSGESVQDIVNVAVTTEALAVTLLGVALDNAAKGMLALDAEQRQTLRAARAAEQAHHDYLVGMGAEPMTTAFTLPDPKIVTDVPTFLTTLIALEEASVATYIAAAQAFAILGEARSAQVALQIGAIEAEHRVAARLYAINAGVLSGTPNDVAFEKALYASVGEAATALRQSGFIGGGGEQVSYPGPGAIDTTGVTQLTP